MQELEKYRFALSVSPVPLLLVSDDGIIALSNLQFDELFEYDTDELSGKNVDILVPDQIRQHHNILRDAYMRLPTKRTMGANRDLEGVTKTGKRIPLELGLEPVEFDGHGGALVVALDLAQRRRHENRLRTAMDATPTAMIMVDNQSRITFANKSVMELLGYDELNLLKQPIEMLVPDEFKPAHPVYVTSFMHNKASRTLGGGTTLHARHKDGTSIPVEIALTPVSTEGEGLIMCTLTDLSERTSARIELEQKNAELSDLNQDLSQFAYSASHDLKAPLATIVGLMNICIEDFDDDNLDTVRENFDMILEIAKRSTNKVEGVLEIARASRGKAKIEQVDVEAQIQNYWTDLGGSAKQVELELDLTHKEPISMELATFGVILENLLSNALRYSDSSKKSQKIKIHSHLDEQGFHMSISDNGIGIPEKNQKHVFKMFRRLDERSADGLGLALVKKQLDRLGGKISLCSEDGKGSEFEFFIPISEEEPV